VLRLMSWRSQSTYYLYTRDVRVPVPGYVQKMVPKSVVIRWLNMV